MTASVTSTVSRSYSGTATRSQTGTATPSHTPSPTATVTLAPIFQSVSFANALSAPALTQPATAFGYPAPWGVLLPVFNARNDDDDLSHALRDSSCNVVVSLSYYDASAPVLSWQTFKIAQTNGPAAAAASFTVKLRNGYTSFINLGKIQPTGDVNLQLYYQTAGGSFVATQWFGSLQFQHC